MINFESYKNVTVLFFKIKTLILKKRVSRKWWCPFSMLETLRVLRKWWSPFSVLKTLRQWCCLFSGLKTSRVVRMQQSPFFSIKNFKSCKAVVEFSLSFKNFKIRQKVIVRVLFQCNASLSFHMMIKFPGTTFSLSVPTEFLWL